MKRAPGSSLDSRHADFIDSTLKVTFSALCGPLAPLWANVCEGFRSVDLS